MNLKQNDLEYLRDMIGEGNLTVAQANVEMVRMQRVRLVTNRMSAHIRKVLNDAVKAGQLGHMKKDGNKPEAYYHPTFEYLAKAERNAYQLQIISALGKVCC